MGCASSALMLHQDQDFTGMASTTAAFTHHIVSLTSTTYGLLSLDEQREESMSPPPRHRITLRSLLPAQKSDDSSPLDEPVINAWDLMAGLHSDRIPSFRFFPRTDSPDVPDGNGFKIEFEQIFPPKGENRVVLYTTSLRGVRKTFEDCNSVRSAISGLGVMICERDISMDRGYRNELETLLKGRPRNECLPPRVFVNGKYIGGADEVMTLSERGSLAELLQGLPKMTGGYVCRGCGGARFLPCSTCDGSCKIIKPAPLKQRRCSLVIRCSDCNENGLVRCPICS